MKIETYLKKIDENWNQKDILTIQLRATSLNLKKGLLKSITSRSVFYQQTFFHYF